MARLGAQHSEATRHKISDRNNARFADPKERERIAAKLRGKKDSEATKRKKAEAQRRRGGCQPGCTCGRHTPSDEARRRHRIVNAAMWQPGGSRYHETTAGRTSLSQDPLAPSSR